MKLINTVINLLRSIPFLILMILVFPLTRLLVGTVVGTTTSTVPLVIAAFPFVSRLAESSLLAVILLIVLVQLFQSVGTHLAVSSDKRLKKQVK